MPLETDGSLFYLEPALYGIVLPAVVSATVFLVTWFLGRRVTPADRNPGGGLALGAGYLAWWRPARPLATAPVMVILPGLWLAAFFYAQPQRTSLILLAGAALSGGLGCVPGVRRLLPWVRTLLSAVVAAALVALAVWMARAAYHAEVDNW